jgi:putative transposase
MTRSLRRQHSGEVKARAALEVHPVQVTQWKKLAKESLPELFSRLKDLSVKAEAELKERLYRKIGRLEMELDWLKKSLAWAVPERRRLIEPTSTVISLTRQCELVGLSRSGWYYEAVPEDPENLRLKRLLDEQDTRTPFYGGRRMTVWLQKDRGETVNLKRVRRLRREMGLEAVYAKPRLSLPDEQRARYPYLLRNLAITRPNHVWATDITYIRLRQGFVYLMAVMDWFSRYVVSWRVSVTVEAAFCMEAVEGALGHARPEIFNSDQGAQFTGTAFTGRLKAAGIRISHDGRGRVFDNIFVERLWRTVT